MPSNPISLDGRFIPEVPLHPDGPGVFQTMVGMLDGNPKDAAQVEAELAKWDGVLDQIAAEQYRIASMLLGEGEVAIAAVEGVVAAIDLNSCSDPEDARHQARMLLAENAIASLVQGDPASLAAPEGESGPASCIEDDDLSAAGVTPAELEQMISGPENRRLRQWLEGLTPQLRVIFVLRAIAGLNSAEVAGLLSLDGGEQAQGWTPDGVRIAFRQALCSLASQLIHLSAAR
ncbi:hypothetical protein ACFPT7_09675 [Acidicapsa dinghuensis]|uniref:Uncharacterized protein n=1 Tax=Acidicapsa dinghuensis TaxID=2218256 RepID=A0ABW1EHV8_9BACT|nr:hypothetical protein [Acidicapsa dinghuensis]